MDAKTDANKDSNKEHLLVRKFLEEHSLVESNILSFNNFNLMTA